MSKNKKLDNCLTYSLFSKSRANPLSPKPRRNIFPPASQDASYPPRQAKKRVIPSANKYQATPSYRQTKKQVTPPLGKQKKASDPPPPRQSKANKRNLSPLLSIPLSRSSDVHGARNCSYPPLSLLHFSPSLFHNLLFGTDTITSRRLTAPTMWPVFPFSCGFMNAFP